MKHIINGNCPRCHKAPIFCDKNPYNFKKMFLIHEHCDSCGLKFNREPGFFYGAMYVGYGLSVAYLTSFYVAMVVLFGEFELSSYFIFGIGSLFLLTPVVFRISRSIWISFFVKYDQESIQKWKESTQGKEKIPNPCIDV